MGAGKDERLDRDLVELAQHGDRDAFAILARTHGDRLMAIAHRISGMSDGPRTPSSRR
jgi:hypothetical protein